MNEASQCQDANSDILAPMVAEKADFFCAKKKRLLSELVTGKARAKVGDDIADPKDALAATSEPPCPMCAGRLVTGSFTLHKWPTEPGREGVKTASPCPAQSCRRLSAKAS